MTHDDTLHATTPDSTAAPASSAPPSPSQPSAGEPAGSPLEGHRAPDAAHAADAPDAGDEGRGRKERVLHTRVPGVLEDELKRLATSLRVPVSNVVRAILEDAVEAADRVSRRTEGGLRGWTDRLAEERVRLRERVVPPRPRETAPATPDGSPAPLAPAPGTSGARTPDAPAPLAGVLGFQALLLATVAHCTLCGRELGAGEEAFLGIREATGPRVLLGRECLPGRMSAG